MLSLLKSRIWQILLVLILMVLPKVTMASRVERTAFQSEHFSFLIDQAKSENISYLASQFEASYEQLTKFYDFSPDKRIQVLFLDEDDFANGYAFSAQGWVVIFLPQIDFDLRGRTTWLPNVISHELAHIITLRKMGETSRFLGFQLMASLLLENQTAFDLGANINWYSTPAWFAEGLAQYGSQICGHDTLDSFRKMILKTAHQKGDLLSLPEMVTFGWDARRNEMVYTQGYFLTAYLFEKFGQEKMNRLLAAMAEVSFEKSFEKILSKSLNEVYTEWISSLNTQYGIKPPSQREKTWLSVEENAPYVNQASPVIAADGQMAFLSSHRNDYGMTDLYLKQGDVITLLKRQVDGTLNLTPDGKKLLFTCLKPSWKNFRLTRDLYQYDFSDQKMTQLTWNSRVTSGAMDSNGMIYTFSEYQGRTRFSRLENNVLVPITDFPISVNGSGLVPGRRSGEFLAEITTGRGSDIYSIQKDNGSLKPLLTSQADERNPRWDAKAECLVYSANYSGTYQVFTLKNDSIRAVTEGDLNHLDPYLNQGILYSTQYSSRGFLLDSIRIPDTDLPLLSQDSLAPNQAFIIPSKTKVTQMNWGDDGMKFLGYSAFAQLNHVRKQKLIFSSKDPKSPLFNLENPGSYTQWSLGGAGIWTHPGSESQAYLQAAVSDEFDEDMRGDPYLAEVLAAYSNSSFGPLLNGYFQSKTSHLGKKRETQAFLNYTLINFVLSLDWTLNTYFSSSSFAAYTGITVKGEEEFITNFSGGGVFLGEQFQFVIYQPGVHFPNQLLFLGSGIGVAPGIGSQETLVHWSTLSLASNSLRKIFYNASTNMSSVLDSTLRIDFQAQGSVALDLKANLKISLPSSRPLALTHIFPSLGMGYSYKSNSRDNSEAMYSGIRKLMARNSALPLRSAHTDFLNEIQSGQVDANMSLTFKMVTPLKNIAYWQIFYAFPLTGNREEGFFGLNLDF